MATGRYEIILNVVDTLTNEISKQEAIHILEVLDYEQPYITADETVDTGQPVSFDASNTNLPNLEIEEYYWMFGDGARKKGVRTEHIYSSPGVYRVQLGVTGRSKWTGEKAKICVFRDIKVK